MIDIVKSFLETDAERQKKRIEGRYYTRTGACNQCGKCCKDIYLINGEQTIQTIAEFEELKPANPDYEFFTPIDQDEHGVRFQCRHLSPQNTCTIYQNRPDFCRNYPSEKGILLGGNLAKGCGYHFELRQTFDSVLAEMAKKKSLKPGKLVSP